MGWTFISFTSSRRKERDADDHHARWPGSIIEQMKIIEPLTNPTAMANPRRTLSMS